MKGVAAGGRIGQYVSFQLVFESSETVAMDGLSGKLMT